MEQTTEERPPQAEIAQPSEANVQPVAPPSESAPPAPVVQQIIANPGPPTITDFPPVKDIQIPEDQVPDMVKLFIGQIPREMTTELLNQTFAEFGPLTECKLLVDHATGLHRGCGFVTYPYLQSAEAAIAALNEKKYFPPSPKPIQVKLADGEKERLDYKIFVGALARATTEADLFAIFSPYGDLTECKVLRDLNGTSKCCGFIQYAARRLPSLKAIQALNGAYTFQGHNQPVIVKFADTPKEKAKKQAAVVPQYPYGAVPAYPGYEAYQDPYARQMMGAYGAYPQAGYGAPDYSYYAQGQPAYPPPNVRGPTSQNKEGPLGANLFICYLPQEVTDPVLYSMFAPFGEVLSARIFVDPKTQLSKCFGFVSYSNPQSAQAAIASLDGMQVGNKRLKVQLKKNEATGSATGRPY